MMGYFSIFSVKCSVSAELVSI